MSITAETIIVAVVVGIAVAWGVRAIYRSVKKGTVCSSCGDSGDCPLTSKDLELTDLKDFQPHDRCDR